MIQFEHYDVVALPTYDIFWIVVPCNITEWIKNETYVDIN